MPIDYKKYPSNWKTEIRPMILARAGNKCEWCGVENHAMGIRDERGKFHKKDNSIFFEDPNFCPKLIKIVLTIAHIHDPNPMNCDPSNLAALCQKCHNGHDAKMRAKNRRKKKFKNQLELFVSEEK